MPLLVYVFGLDPKTAIASSLVVVGSASAFGALNHWRRGNVEVRTALLFGLAGMAGAYLGGRAGSLLDGRTLLLLFAGLMALTAAAMWRGRSAPTGGVRVPSAPGRLVAQGFAVGTLTGLLGAGGGFLIVPALALWAGLPMGAAVGTSLLVIVLNTLAGFLGYRSHVEVDTALIGGVTVAAIAGSFLGARLAHRVDPTSLRRAFAVFVACVAAFIFVREAGAWAPTARSARVAPAEAP